jgi:hypothetical protein
MVRQIGSPKPILIVTGQVGKALVLPGQPRRSNRSIRTIIQIRWPSSFTGEVDPIHVPGERLMPATATRNQGKSKFVKEVLNDNPQANGAAVNEAWRAAGMSGSISAGLVNNLRFRLGLAGNLPGGRRKRTRATGTRQGRPPMQVGNGANGSTAAMARKQSSELMGLEVEIDRLLMKMAEVGQLPHVEDALRRVRRQIYAGMIAGS